MLTRALPYEKHCQSSAVHLVFHYPFCWAYEQFREIIINEEKPFGLSQDRLKYNTSWLLRKPVGKIWWWLKVVHGTSPRQRNISSLISTLVLVTPKSKRVYSHFVHVFIWAHEWVNPHSLAWHSHDHEPRLLSDHKCCSMYNDHSTHFWLCAAQYIVAKCWYIFTNPYCIHVKHLVSHGLLWVSLRIR